jgi:hypothetical protein
VKTIDIELQGSAVTVGEEWAIAKSSAAVEEKASITLAEDSRGEDGEYVGMIVGL